LLPRPDRPGSRWVEQPWSTGRPIACPHNGRVRGRTKPFGACDPSSTSTSRVVRRPPCGAERDLARDSHGERLVGCVLAELRNEPVGACRRCRGPAGESLPLCIAGMALAMTEGFIVVVALVARLTLADLLAAAVVAPVRPSSSQAV